LVGAFAAYLQQVSKDDNALTTCLLRQWLEAQSAQPELWVHRLRVACEIAEAALRVKEPNFLTNF